MVAALLLSFLSPCKRPLPAPRNRNRLLCLARLGRWEYTSRRGTAAVFLSALPGLGFRFLPTAAAKTFFLPKNWT